jgi:hypothetical protein
MSPDLDATIQAGADEAFAELDLVDLNVVLHRADGEEKDATGKLALNRMRRRLIVQVVMEFIQSQTMERSFTVVSKDG